MLLTFVKATGLRRSLINTKQVALMKPNIQGNVACTIVAVFTLFLGAVCAHRTMSALAITSSSSLDTGAACALSLTRYHLADTTHITVLGRSSWLDYFLEATDVPVTLLQPGECRMQVHNLQYDVIFLLFEEAWNRTMKDVLRSVRKMHNRHYARLVVWWLAGDIQAAVQAARDLDLVQLVLVHGAGQQVFTYREDCQGGLGKAKAVEAGRCTETGLLYVHENLFPDRLRWNQQGCTLQVGTVHLPPDIILTPRPAGGYELSGVLLPAVKALAQRINATFNVSSDSDGTGFGWGFPNGTAWGLVGDVIHKRRDLGVSDFIRAKDRSEVVELSPGYKMVSFCVTVPAGIGPRQSSWYLVFQMFKPSAWTFLGVSYLLFLASWSMPWKDPDAPSVDTVALFMLSALLGSSYTATSFASSRAKILGASWMLLTIVLDTAYNALRHSHMAAPSPKAEIETLHQIENRGLKVMGPATTLDILKINAEAEGNTSLIKLAAASEGTLDIEAAVKRMTTAKNVAVFEDPAITLYHAAPMEKTSGRLLVHVLRNFCAFTSHVATFMMRQGSPLTVPANYLISRAFECGLTQHWESRFQPWHPGTKNGKKKLQLSKLKLYKLEAVFNLLLIGLAAAVAVFASEVLIFRLTSTPRRIVI